MSDAAATNLESAYMLAQIVRAPSLVDETSARQLQTLMEAQMSDHKLPNARYERIGLLIEISLSRPGEYITEGLYEEQRAKESAGRWKSATAIARSYGSWILAVDNAARFARGGTSAGVAEPHRARHPYSYAPEVLVEILIGAFRDLGHWPVPNEYKAGRRIRRQSARNGGQEEPHIPDIDTFRRSMGSYRKALMAAQKELERTQSVSD